MNIRTVSLDGPRAAVLRRRTNVDARGQSFEDRLRMARERAGLTQIALAASAGLAKPVVYDLESKRKNGAVQARTVGLLAKALGVSLDWLWFGEV